MAMIFGKAREMSPCMLVIEDLDSHINDRNRSFFLNQARSSTSRSCTLIYHYYSWTAWTITMGCYSWVPPTTSIVWMEASPTDRVDLTANSTPRPPFSQSNHSFILSLFDAPNLSERRQYAVYWQSKLKKNPDIEFPDSLLDVIAESTNGFSFAYLKEVL